MDAVAIARFNLKILHLATGVATDLRALNSTLNFRFCRASGKNKIKFNEN